MPALKNRKKPSKTAKRIVKKVIKKAAAKRTKKAIKARPSKARRSARAKQPPPHPDQTTVRLGPHHVDRHPYTAGIQVHPAPQMHQMGSMAKQHSMTIRHH